MMSKSSGNINFDIDASIAADQDDVGVVLIDCSDEGQMALLTDEQRAEVQRRIADPNRVLISYEEAVERISRLISE